MAGSDSALPVGFFGLGLLHGGKAVHDALERSQRGFGVRPLGRDVDGRVFGDTQLQQGHEVFGVARLAAHAHAHAGGKAPGRFHPLLGRARVQAVGVGHEPVKALGKVARRGGIGSRGGGALLEGGQDVVGVLRGGQLVQRGLVLQQAGEAAQQRQVLVRLRGDGKDERGALLGIPGHALRHLQHGNAGARNHVAIGNLPVRNGHAVAQKGVGRLLARQQAVDIGGGDAACIGQQLPGLADGLGLVGGGSAQADELGLNKGGVGRGGGVGHGVFLLNWGQCCCAVLRRRGGLGAGDGGSFGRARPRPAGLAAPPGLGAA